MTNRIFHCGALIFVIALATALDTPGQQQPKKPDNAMTPDAKMGMDEMNQRGDKVMGFDHTKTTHHFILAGDGGVIQVEANDADDKVSSDEIRLHLRHIAMMFGEGNFNAPMLVHAQDPPGVDVMKQLKAEITYKFEETKQGGRVSITATNKAAIKAIHEFLRFQIKEHHTADSLEVVK